MSFSLARVSAALSRPSLGSVPLSRVSMLSDHVKAEAVEKLEELPIVPTEDFVDTDGVERTGTVLTAVGHTITAVIGAGVLNLPYAISMLGWAAGPISLLIFSVITLYTSQLLADCGILKGVRQRTYTDVVFSTFGMRGYHIVGWVQHSNLLVTALAYQITGSLTMQSLAKSICASQGKTDCFDTYWHWAVIFAGIQLFMVQLPDLSYFWWASLIGAAMSFSYATIALGLSIAEGNTHGTVGGQSLAPSPKAFGVLNSIGAVLFAYSFSMILIEIQDTMRSVVGVGVVKPMRRAVTISVVLMTSFYMAVAIAGYMAFGNAVPPNILNGFSGPRWVVNWANAMVLIHMIPAYQVYAQPLLSFIEFHFNRWPKAPKWSTGWTTRVVFRSLFVAFIGFLAVCLPFFNDIVGLVGALGFWPLSVFFPIECWIIAFKPDKRKKFWLRALNIGCCIVTIAATVGSVQLIVIDSGNYQAFG